jgi:calcium-binding protein CML
VKGGEKIRRRHGEREEGGRRRGDRDTGEGGGAGVPEVRRERRRQDLCGGAGGRAARAGRAVGPGEVRRMMEEMDADRDGFIDLDEFVAFHCASAGDEDDSAASVSEAELREAFRMYDADRNGLISARDLHRVLRQLGDKCSVADCSRMIRSVDADGDGSVNFDEFKKMMGAGAGGKH